MSTLSQALTNQVVAVVLALGAVFGGNWAWKFIQSWRLANDQKAYMANAAINHLSEAINTAVLDLKMSMTQSDTRMLVIEKLLKDAATNSEKLLAGSLKACEAIATETAQHRASVEAFSKNLFGQEANDRAREALEIPSERDKDKHFREMEYRAAGSTDTEARDLAEQDLAHTESIYPSS